MRTLGKSAPKYHEHRTSSRLGKRVFTKQTLEAFKEVRDALKASQETGGRD
ncbi:MAG: hypothetical protein ACTSPB_12395 [Candidatus Thorarchaeota archaeon]